MIIITIFICTFAPKQFFLVFSLGWGTYWRKNNFMFERIHQDNIINNTKWPGVNFINTKSGSLNTKYQRLNAKRWHFQSPISKNNFWHLKYQKVKFKIPKVAIKRKAKSIIFNAEKRHLSFMKWTPCTLLETDLNQSRFFPALLLQTSYRPNFDAGELF